MNLTTVPIIAMSRHRIAIDGAGIRTLIVTTGCPLRCAFCINPFTWDGTKKPKKYTVSQLHDRVVKDRLYFLATNGGLTFGGGEPLLHASFIHEFCQTFHDCGTVNIETSLHVQRQQIEMIEGDVNIFIVDIKSMDPATYHRYTGGDLHLALHNLEYLLTRIGPQRLYVRVPLIPGFNDEVSQEASVEKLRSLGVTQIQKFTYRVNN